MNDTRYITVLSVLSSLAVVFLHVNGCFWTFGTDARWISANIIESVFYFAVPVFFMISGATLIDYRARYDTKTYVKKRVFKTLIPFIIWSFIWLIASTLDGRYTAENFTLQFFIKGIFNTGFSSTYWFFIPLFTCYACIIVLSLIPEEYKQKIFLFLIIAGFLTISLLPFIFGFLNINFNSDLKLPLTGGGYLLFVLFGYYVNKYDIKLIFRIIIYCLGIVGLLTHLLGTHFASFNAGQIVQTYKGYLNVPSIVYASAIFTFFKYVKKGKIFNGIYKICKFISPMSFGIYLIHSLILEFFIYKLPFDSTNIFFRTFGALGLYVVCGAIVWCIQRIPILKKLTP